MWNLENLQITSLLSLLYNLMMDVVVLSTNILECLKYIHEDCGKHPAHPVAENAPSYSWGNLTLAVQLLLPLALVALILAKKRIWIYPYPLLDTYVSALCPSFSKQQRLLKWLSSRIPHMNNLPNKITQYWQNGSLLCTLINTVVPGACPNPQKHWKQPPLHGQALAYKYLGVAPVLTEDDFSKNTLSSYAERKFIKYLLLIQEAISKVSIEEDSLKFTSKYVARGMGLVIGEQNRPSIFYVYPNTGSKSMENILVNIKGPYNTFGSGVVTSVGCPSSEEFKNLVKMKTESSREQKKLAYKSKAQKSFFRSVSFDIAPFMNLMSAKKNTGEIMVKIDMEDDRTKVTFLPKFSGIYELLLTNDGQHLQGSPFVIRIMKNNKEVESALKEAPKLIKSKIERKIIAKSIDFINESVNVTDDFYSRFDPNNNTNSSTSETNKSDDESSTYQDSGIFDLNEQTPPRNKLDLEEIDEDIRFSEEHESAESKDSKVQHSNLEYLVLENGDNQRIEVHDEAIFLTRDTDTTLKIAIRSSEVSVDPRANRVGSLENLEQELFGCAELESSQEFERLYNKYADTAEEECSVPSFGKIELVGKEGKEKLTITKSRDNETPQNAISTDFEILPKDPQLQKAEVTQSAESLEDPQNINSTDFEVLSNIPEFQKGKQITSVGRMVEIFDNSSKKPENTYLTIAEKKIDSYDFTIASPVLTDTAQEAADPVPVEDSAHLARDIQISSMEKRPTLTRNFSICIDEEEVYDTNVKEIKNIFEKKKEVKVPSGGLQVDLKKDLQTTKRKLAKSMPNLLQDSKEEESDAEDEFVLRFKEKRNFWNNLISQNSNSCLNVSTSDCSSNNTKLLSRNYQNVSQSTNSLNTYYRSNKLSTVNKWTRRKEELFKTASLDLSNTYSDVSNADKHIKVAKAESLYDRIRIFDKDFNIDKHSTVLRRTKERSNLKEDSCPSEILRPESFTEIPNTNSNDQVKEDLQFAEIMKERFEISRRYFSSLESLNVKRNLTRRHSMDSKPTALQEKPLQKGGSLKVLNVLERFSLDNVYKDVILSKMKNCSFKGAPNKEAVVETLSSVSSCENFETITGKDHVEEDDLNLQFFNIKKRLRKRRSIKSIFDVNY